MERIVISDTNIFIDIMNSEMLSEFFMLPVEIYTTDFVLKEIKPKEQKAALEPYIRNQKLHVLDFGISELSCISNLMNNCKTNASFTDCSVWYASKKLGGRLLTGDSKLRAVVEKDDIPVSGILYIFDHAVKYGIISRQEAAIRLTQLLSTNIRLPMQECQLRISEWSHSCPTMD